MTDADKLALGLDDIIRLNRTPGRRGGGGGGGMRRGFRGRGFAGRGGVQSNGFRTRGGGGLPRASTAPAGRWEHDLFDDNTNRNRVGQRTSGMNSTTKLIISNLDYNVTTDDIRELFEDVGPVRTSHVHFDESGQSLGTAEVVFERRLDAATALKKYNGLNLDGRPMDIKLVGNVDGGVQTQSNRGTFTNGAGNGNQKAGFRNRNQQNGNRGLANRLRGGRQANGVNENTTKNNVTKEDLDADLDAYLSGATTKKP